MAPDEGFDGPDAAPELEQLVQDGHFGGMKPVARTVDLDGENTVFTWCSKPYGIKTQTERFRRQNSRVLSLKTLQSGKSLKQ